MAINIKKSKKGTFTNAAKERNKSVQAFADHVLANKDKYSPAMVKKANFAKNASEWNHFDDGGLVDEMLGSATGGTQGVGDLGSAAGMASGANPYMMLGQAVSSVVEPAANFVGNKIDEKFGNGLPTAGGQFVKDMYSGGLMGPAKAWYNLATGKAKKEKKNIVSEMSEDSRNNYVDENSFFGGGAVQGAASKIKKSKPVPIEEGNPNQMNFGYVKGGEIKAYNNDLAKDDVKFIKWYNKNTLEGKNNIPYTESLDYDYYSYFKNNEKNGSVKKHFPDTYKRPNHQTFSNESIYSTPENPGGKWEGNKYNPNGEFLYAKGGEIKGKGTGKSDSINMNANPGDFIVSAGKMQLEEVKDLFSQLGLNTPAKKNNGSTPIKVSNGEGYIPKELLSSASNILSQNGMTLADLTDDAIKMCKGGKIKRYAKAGVVEGDPDIIMVDGFEYNTKTGLYYSPGSKYSFDKEGNFYEKGEKVNLSPNDKSRILRNKDLYSNLEKERKRMEVEKNIEQIGEAKINEENKEKKGSDAPIGTSNDRFIPETLKALKAGQLTSEDIESLSEEDYDKLLELGVINPVSASWISENADDAINTYNKEQGVLDKTDAAGSKFAQNIANPDDISGKQTADATGQQNKFRLPEKINVADILSAGQIAAGATGLATMDKEPQYEIDKDFLTAVERSKGEAKYGFEPGEYESATHDIARSYASGKKFIEQLSASAPGNALANTVQLLNASNRAKLKLNEMNKAIQMKKQGYSDQLVMAKTDLSKFKYGESERKWERDQLAFADLMNAGIGNMIGSQEHKAQMGWEDYFRNNTGTKMTLPTTIQ